MIRAGLDYKEYCSLRKHVDWKEFWTKESPNIDQCYAFTTKTERSAFEIKNLKTMLGYFLVLRVRGYQKLKKNVLRKNLLRIPMVRKAGV